MNNSNFLSHNPIQRRHGLSFFGLIMAAVFGVCGVAGSATVHAQSTAGSIFGKAPAGDSVVAKSTTTGVQRHTTADASGRYRLGQLPMGVYTVTLKDHGTPVVKRPHVQVIVGRGINVDFDCSENQCTAH